MKRTILIGLISLTPAAFGQTGFFSPAPFAHHQGITSTGYPIGYPHIKKMTYQQIHGLLPSKPFPIRKFAWRPASLGKNHGAFKAKMSLKISIGGPTPDSATSNFSSNLGNNPIAVFTNTWINFPAFKQAAAAPAPYHYVIPFSKPVIYKPTNGIKTLCWELRVHDHTNKASLNFDLYSSSNQAICPGGLGCSINNQTSPVSLKGRIYSGQLSLTSSYLPANSPAILLIGNKNMQFGSLTLPFDLSPMGAPCSLRTSIEFMANKISSSTGTATWNLGLPGNSPGGTAIFFQVLAAHSKANKLGLVLSNGLAVIQPYTKRPVVRIWQSNNDKATTGNRQTSFGLIVKFSL